MWSPIDTSFFNEKNTPSFFIILPKTRERLQNQKARTPEPAGVLEGEKIPTLRNITPLDLRRIDRLEVLFVQAAHAGWMQPSGNYSGRNGGE